MYTCFSLPSLIPVASDHPPSPCAALSPSKSPLPVYVPDVSKYSHTKKKVSRKPIFTSPGDLCLPFPSPPLLPPGRPDQALSFSSSPQSSTATPVAPLPLAIISRTSAELYFLVTTFLTDRPLFSLSSSCALIQHLAIRFCAISTPPGKPALTLPPSHHGFSTRSKECSNAVKGRAAAETRCEEA